jgi:ABC-2 type transport system permease protein
MWRKILAIAWKDLYTTYTDRTLLLIMLATPLAISSIIGAAFSGFIGGGSAPVQDVPVIVVNLDAGVTLNGQAINQGAAFVDALVPPGDPDPDNMLHALTDARVMTDPAAARAEVDSGRAAAALIIPEDFSRSITYAQDIDALQPVVIEVYGSPASPVSTSVVESIARGFADQIAAGSITVAATIDALVARAQSNPLFGLQFAAASASGAFQPDFSTAFMPDAGAIRIEQQTLAGARAGFNPLVSFGSAQALFFMMFTAFGASVSILEERRDGTLQRQAVTPTPLMALLVGKMLGTLVTCIVQVGVLLIALTLVGSLIAGQFQFIWGDNIVLIALVVVVASLAAGGLGALIASLVRTSEQANIIGSVVSLIFGLFSGAFFDVSAIPGSNIISRLTINYWGVEAFSKLSQGMTEIGLNLIVLTTLGALFLTIGLFVFNRRLSI